MVGRFLYYFVNIVNLQGTVEVEDQVEGLQMLAERTGGFMDMSRVVVHGWSYGGYMALQMIAKHPNVIYFIQKIIMFKIPFII